jgi:nickel/cobalt transporter (NicO) family protein
MASGRHMRATRVASMATLAGLALAALLTFAPVTGAHPLGNFSVNHQTRVKISRDQIELLYVLDQAEIPTFQERHLSREEVIHRKLAEVRRSLVLIVNGNRLLLRRASSPKLTFPAGQGGLEITRLEVPFAIPVRAPRSVEIRDTTFPNRVGWVDLVSLPGHGTAVATYVSASDATNALRDYKGVTLKGVPDQVIGRFAVRPGHGSLTDLSTGTTYGSGEGPAFNPPARATEGGKRSEPAARGGEEDGFADVFDRAAQGEGVFLLMLLAAFAWGALHALSPGHGKAMVAAYLVGTRGTPLHAVALGAIVTITHTIGVFALGLVTLLLAQYILPEDLYPWLNLVAGLLIVGVGAGVLRSRLRWRKARHGGFDAPAEAAQGNPDAHDHGHSHRLPHSHDHQHPHGSHSHDHTPETTWKGLAGMGISAGIIPCPTALVVLLAAISQHQIGLGLLLIAVFSLGLACTLTTLGLLVVSAKRLLARASSRVSLSGRLASALPAASTLVILGLGLVLTAKALPDVL